MVEASCSQVGLGVEVGGPVRDEYHVKRMYPVGEDRYLHSRQEHILVSDSARSAPRQLMGTRGNRHLQHGWHISYSSEYDSVEMGSGY